ncbi:hypothetical protein A6V39_04010 [Candidatus Mycoplasma haematobovis]|uniref:Uncharacterized protein n=1 Tax=Candidatus Mycoplasma haematobovis TaxID=432608 RepID=A0A1A9QC69_9MOLU|nr:hypothetical protein [Candidatus Mycoplasma haematobovis]OAL10053.1 hypothetical protein A6V39_04010 [Candidatus Mycoplasma haematobovis]
MISLFSLAKVAVPSVTVGVVNLVVYLSLKIHTNKQINYRKYKIQKHFQTVKDKVIDNLIDSNEDLMKQRHGEIESYFRSMGNVNKLQGQKSEELFKKWKEIAPDGTRITLTDDKKSNFFQEVRYYCTLNKGSDDVKLLVEISKLCSNELVDEKAFELPENK